MDKRHSGLTVRTLVECEHRVVVRHRPGVDIREVWLLDDNATEKDVPGGACMTPEMLAALPPEVRQELHRKLVDTLREMGVTPMITPDGTFCVDLTQLAPALGMTIEEAQEHLDEAGMQGTDRDDLVPLQ